MDKDLFADLIASCKETIEYQKGNLQLKTTVLELSDEEIERSRIFYQNFERLTEQGKKKAIQYVNELLQASGG